MTEEVSEDDLPPSNEAEDFGRRLLLDMGWKEGTPIQKGGPIQQYVPSAVGGFIATTAVTNLESEARVGKIVVVDGFPCEIMRCDGNSAEVEFADRSRRKVAVAIIKAAGVVDREQFEHSRRTAEDTAGTWIVPRLLIRVVEAPIDDPAPQSFQPYKAAVVRVEHTARGIRVALDNGRSVLASACDTVLPKSGERGLVVAGEHKGRMVTVVDRVKSRLSSGTEALIVSLPSSSERIRMGPDQVCQVAVSSVAPPPVSRPRSIPL